MWSTMKRELISKLMYNKINVRPDGWVNYLFQGSTGLPKAVFTHAVQSWIFAERYMQRLACKTQWNIKQLFLDAKPAWCLTELMCEQKNESSSEFMIQGIIVFCLPLAEHRQLACLNQTKYFQEWERVWLSPVVFYKGERTLLNNNMTWFSQHSADMWKPHIWLLCVLVMNLCSCKSDEKNKIK